MSRLDPQLRVLVVDGRVVAGQAADQQRLEIFLGLLGLFFPLLLLLLFLGLLLGDRILGCSRRSRAGQTRLASQHQHDQPPGDSTVAGQPDCLVATSVTADSAILSKVIL